MAISIHALREEGDSTRCSVFGPQKYFYPRPPRGGRPCFCSYCGRLYVISIHALREEGDAYPRLRSVGNLRFLSTPSARRATNCPVVADIEVGISIHALREEGDPCSAPCLTSPADFYPRPPRGGRPLMMSAGSSSTNFYPRPPRGGRLQSLKQPRGVVCISIHALREEGDFTACAICLLSIDISIHALREEGDRGPAGHDDHLPISIHALREEGDSQPLAVKSISMPYFYPRPPRGGRPSSSAVRAASCAISIHALREEGDVASTIVLIVTASFLSTPSARRATPCFCRPVRQAGAISIHALREEGDFEFKSGLDVGALFLSTPSARRAT